MFQDTLTSLGLSREAAEIYQALLEKGPQTAIGLAKSTKVKRTYVYAVTRDLITQGLVTQDKQGRTTQFVAQSPDHLLKLAESQKLAAEQAQTALENVLPQLKSQYALSETKPVVTYYEGREGIKKVFQATLSSKSEILAFVGTQKPDQEIWDWLRNSYTKQRIDAKIPVKVIVATGKKMTEYTQKDKQELRQTKIVDSKTYFIGPEINIFDNKIALMQYYSGDTLLGTIIENQSIADTFRSWFKLTWNIA